MHRIGNELRLALAATLVCTAASAALAAPAPASPAAAAQPPLAAQPVDALTASPDNFRLMLENDRVRVLEYTLLPGRKDQRHTHPQRVAHVISGGRLRVHFPDGRHLDFDEKTGDSSWSAASPLHDTENIGTTPIKILLVEVKEGTTP